MRPMPHLSGILLAVLLSSSMDAAEARSEVSTTSSPHFLATDGRPFEILSPLEKNKESDWLRLAFPTTAARKIGVQVRIEDSDRSPGLDAFAAVLEQSLMRTGRFRVFGAGSRTVARKGHAYVLTVRSFECDIRRKTHALGGLGSNLVGGVAGTLMDSARLKSMRAEVVAAVELKLASTGELVGSEVVHARATHRDLGVGIAVAGNDVSDEGRRTADAAASPISSDPVTGQAIRIVANKCALLMYTWLHFGEADAVAHRR